MMHLNSMQNAYVTRDLDKAVAQLTQTHGLRNFIYFDPDIEVKTPAGVGRAQTRVAMAWAGATQIEIIQPVAGLVDLYQPYLAADDSMRFHHCAVRVDDWPVFCEKVARNGYTVAYASGLDGLEFMYLDARQTLGHYVEYIWATPHWWKAMGAPGY
ncbi:MAG TPA: VOC family protein [Steroidobacteraceae bacterium]|jgi:hypothetical protein|nr:VOC family protein [Steroidobacteraceae bacterium]